MFLEQAESLKWWCKGFSPQSESWHLGPFSTIHVMALRYLYSYNSMYWHIYFYFISFASIIFIFSHNSDSVTLHSALCCSCTEGFCVSSTHSDFFNLPESVHLKYIQIYIQQDATLHSLFISGNCSTCFGWYLHPSSGANTTVFTASGTCQPLLLPAAIAAGSSNGVTRTRCCKCSCVCSWWWVEVPPETCRTVFQK